MNTIKNNNVIFILTGNSNSFDHRSMTDEKNEFNLDCSINLNNDFVTSTNPEGI